MASVEDAHWWWCARREILEDVIRSHAPAVKDRPRRVLEVGCGTGGNLAMLAKFGTVLGAETEDSAIADIRAKYGDKYHVIKHGIPQPLEGSFDIIGMFDVIEHIEQDASALAWAMAQLTPGGILVVTAPAIPSLWTEHDEAAHHFRRYTRASLAGILPVQAEVLHLTYFNSLLFPLVAAARWGTKLLPKALRPQGTNMGLPPAPLNRMLFQVFRTERKFVPKRSLPVGVSVLAVLRRPLGSA